MKEHYLQLFKYDDWASRKLLTVVVENEIYHETLLQRFTHILFARQIWLWRILGKSELPEQLEQPTLEELVEAFEADRADWLNYLEKTPEADFFQMIAYRNTSGTPFESRINDLLTHVVNHSTYHRGQITAILKPLHEAVPSTDFIFFLRDLEN